MNLIFLAWDRWLVGAFRRGWSWRYAAYFLMRSGWKISYKNVNGIDGNMSTIFPAVGPKTASNERIERRPLATVFNEPCTTRVHTTKWYIGEIDKIVDLKTRKEETVSTQLKRRRRRRRRRWRRPNDPWKGLTNRRLFGRWPFSLSVSFTKQIRWLGFRWISFPLTERPCPPPYTSDRWSSFDLLIRPKVKLELC